MVQKAKQGEPEAGTSLLATDLIVREVDSFQLGELGQALSWQGTRHAVVWQRQFLHASIPAAPFQASHIS